MLIGIGIGIVLSVLIIIGLVNLILREDPTGCMVLFGIFIFLVVWSGLVVRWLLFAG